MGPEAKGKTYGERTNPSWNLSEFTNGKEWLLKEVQITGFSPMDQQMTFIRAVIERAPNLRTLVLKDYSPCEDCEQMGVLPRSERLPAERVYPKGKEDQGMKSDDEDRLSMLPDDVLLLILGRVDIATATRISILSTGWKHLPWLLRELTIDVREFLSVPPPNPIEVGHMDEAMVSLTRAAISFLATPRSESTITRLQLKLYLVNTYSDVIGPLRSQATEIGTLEDLDLAIVDEKEPDDCYKEEMRQQARTVDGFLSAYPITPLSFDVAPFLKELSLICGATVDHQGFKLSKVLRDTTSIQNLTLNFEGEKLWIKPEGKQLCTAFKKLRKLSLHGIFVEFDLLWMIVLLEAAPSVEIFDIEFKSCKEWQLKEVHVTGFSPMEQQIALIRAVMQRASNLQTIVLKDYQPCDDRDEIGALTRCERLPPERVFPKGKGEQDVAVEQLIRDMPDCNVQIIFGN
ncbi:unnamed protein product [Miscanthus lutarioriparius]|uniref:F-box domain-containing protein n=1 Tax=Miscanthus lutarioriparius TaxID=422564 RepID=A0A811N514_9POAL|nr:unnamed protein product [Miscanthus lutarioriparius]